MKRDNSGECLMEKIVVNSDYLFDKSDHQSSQRVTRRSLTTMFASVIIG